MTVSLPLSISLKPDLLKQQVLGGGRAVTEHLTASKNTIYLSLRQTDGARKPSVCCLRNPFPFLLIGES